MIEKEFLEDVFNDIISPHPQTLVTGFYNLDCILGNVKNDALITIGGRSSMGKTSFLLSIMINLLKQDKKCLFFSIELSAKNILKRMISQISKIGFCNNGVPYSDISIEKIKNAISEIEKYKIFLEDKMTITINDVKDYIEEVKPDYVFIDYIQIINFKSKTDKCHKISNFVIELKKIARENKCMIFLTSQLSRNPDHRCDKTPILSDLKDCGDLEEISDIVLMLFRESYYDTDDKSNYNNEDIDIICLKNKYGAIGTIKLLFRKELLRFYEQIENDEF